MEYKTFVNSCRICLKRNKKLRSIFGNAADEDEPPNKMLEILTGIVIDETNVDMPKCICKTCELSLNLAFEFRNKALKSQRFIDKYCRKVKYNEQTIQIDKSTEHFFSLSDNVHEEPDDLKTKVEKLDYCVYSYERSESKEFIAIESVGESIIHTLDTEEHYSDRCSEEHSFESPPSTVNVNLNELSHESNIKTIDLKIRKDSTFKNTACNDTYICDVCGNVFAKRSRMMDHRRRHDKALRYACEMCDQRFHLRESLRKHLILHSGKKPFKCSFCSRTFFYESVKKAHEAIHNGYKPFICGTCDKAFAYSHALKKHKLIHANIKYYHCNYCNKDFRLQHHLKQHENTKLHQYAVKTQKDSKSLSI